MVSSDSHSWGLCQPSPFMPYNLDVRGWQGWGPDPDVERHIGEKLPDDLTQVHGMYVHLTDEDNPEDQHWFWSYTLDDFDSWDDWYEYIGHQAAQHGMELA